jgi:hypothetical protein
MLGYYLKFRATYGHRLSDLLMNDCHWSFIGPKKCLLFDIRVPWQVSSHLFPVQIERNLVVNYHNLWDWSGPKVLSCSNCHLDSQILTRVPSKCMKLSVSWQVSSHLFQLAIDPNLFVNSRTFWDWHGPKILEWPNTHSVSPKIALVSILSGIFFLLIPSNGRLHKQNAF